MPGYVKCDRCDKYKDRTEFESFDPPVCADCEAERLCHVCGMQKPNPECPDCRG